MDIRRAVLQDGHSACGNLGEIFRCFPPLSTTIHRNHSREVCRVTFSKMEPHDIHNVSTSRKERAMMKRKDAEKLWTWCIDEESRRENPDMVSGILSNTAIKDLTRDQLIVAVDNDFIRRFIEDRMLESLRVRFRELTRNEKFDLQLVVEKLDRPETPPVDETESDDAGIPCNLGNLNPKYTFRSFVVGSTNQFAHAVCQGVAKSPGTLYNPLFLYGGVGLGKTHLLQAIGNHVLTRNPAAQVIYETSEIFLNEMIDAISTGKIKRFKKKYRSADLLLIDDIQFISGKDTTQEEFFHTFNELHNSGRQIVLSSDRPPHEIQKLERRLISRFESGMVADIQVPDYELRLAILRRKAKELDVRIDDEEVLHYLASQSAGNIRQLEGNFITMVGKAQILRKEINRSLVDDILRDRPVSTTRSLSVDGILQTVAEFYALDPAQLTGKRRSRQIVRPRQVAMYLARELLGTTLDEIGRSFGGRDHSTVLHACNKMDADCQADPSLQQEVQEIRRRLEK